MHTKFTIDQSMSIYPLSVNYNELMSAAYRKMKRENFRHLLVVDELQRLIGIISDRDFQRAMWPVTGYDAPSLADEAFFRDNARVSEYMSFPVISLTTKSDLLEVIERMIKEKISAVVVTEGDNVAGIITHEDLLRILKYLLKEPASLTEKAQAIMYSSPLNKVSEFLAGIGI